MRSTPMKDVLDVIWLESLFSRYLIKYILCLQINF